MKRAGGWSQGAPELIRQAPEMLAQGAGYAAAERQMRRYKHHVGGEAGDSSVRSCPVILFHVKYITGSNRTMLMTHLYPLTARKLMVNSYGSSPEVSI